MQRILRIDDLKALRSIDKQNKKRQTTMNIGMGFLSFLIIFLVWEYLNYGF